MRTRSGLSTSPQGDATSQPTSQPTSSSTADGTDPADKGAASSALALLPDGKQNQGKDAEAKGELVHLVRWLRTCKDVDLDQSAPAVTSENVMDLLSTLSASREVWRVAEVIYGKQESPIEIREADDIWKSLLFLTSTRGRHLSSHGDESGHVKMSPPCLKAHVLSSMVDSFARSAPKSCVPGILTLPKDTQRVLHDLMLRRGPLVRPESVKKAPGSLDGSSTPTDDSPPPPPPAVLRSGAAQSDEEHPGSEFENESELELVDRPLSESPKPELYWKARHQELEAVYARAVEESMRLRTDVVRLLLAQELLEFRALKAEAELEKKQQANQALRAELAAVQQARRTATGEPTVPAE